MKNPVSNKRGFTLVEALVTLVIIGVVITGVYNVYIYLHKTWLAENIKAEMQQKARVAINMMTQDMMMMGYGTGDIDVSPTLHYNATDKILIAGANELQFRMYMEKAGKEYIIRYYMDSTTLKREIKSTDGTESATSYPLAEHVESADLPGVPSLAFKYYRVVNGVLTEIKPLPVASTLLNDIRRITVSMTMRSARAMPGTTNDYKYINLTADISPKNLWEGEMVTDHENPTPPAFLHVVNTGKCGLLKAKWGKASDNVSVAGYIIKYGNIATGQYTNYKSVLVSQLSDPDNPQAEFAVDHSQYASILSSPSNYYVAVAAFDAAGNYSTDTAEAHTSTFANQSGFSQSGDCTINLVRKPGPVSNFTATGDVQSVRLSWSAPTDTNVVGYRIFRSYSSFSSSNFPIDSANLPTSIKQLTKENESGDGWAGSRTDLGVTSYTDADPALKGCTPYFYAICPVTCDSTRIVGPEPSPSAFGGRYTSAQYSVASASPLDSTSPGDPTVASKSGWKRVFLNIIWPTDTDYAYTKVLFALGSTPPVYDPAHPDANLIPDRQIGYDQGTFCSYGTMSSNTIIFNDATEDIADTAMPQLNNLATYAFRAIAFDKCGNASNSATGVATTAEKLCGDEPCGAPTWSTARYVWVDKSRTNLDASTWDNYAADGNTQINIGLKWTSIDTNVIGDFWGYYVSKNVAPSLSGALSLGATAWNNYTESAGLAEGSVYYYGVRAVDCVYANITQADIVDSGCTTPGVPEDYSYVKAHNITADADTLWSGAIKPGKIAKFTRTVSGHPEYNAVTTEGDYHNKVRFYLTNTSQASLQIDWMKLLWGNSSAYLKTITIGPLNDGTTYTYSPGLISNASASMINMGAMITNLATSTTMTSDAIPVLLEFVNLDGTVTASDNMELNVITLEASFTNTSMPNAAGSSSGVDGFTTGIYNGSNPIRLVVSGGPSINYVTQNRPANPTISYEISNVSTRSSMPTSGYPIVNGGMDVTVTANITCPSTETIGAKDGTSGVKIWYTYATDPGALLDAGAATWYSVNATGSGNDFSAVIPGAINKGVWYYVTATTLQGNSTRQPANPGSYFFYKQPTFDPCLEVPNPPTGLGGTSSATSASLTWTPPTTYVSGANIQSSDPLTYKVYRKVGLTGQFKNLSTAAPISSPGYNDTGYPAVSGSAVSYAVSTVNSCNSRVNESALSDPIILCPYGGSGCSFDATPTIMWAGGSINLYIAVCSAVDGTPGEIGVVTATTASGHRLDLTVTEINDTGTAVVSIPTTMSSNLASTGMLQVVGDHDIVTITPKSGTLLASACSGISSIVNVYAAKCDNIPAPPVLTGTMAKSGKVSFSWTAVTTNTDGSLASYSVPAVLNPNLVEDSIVAYELWYSSGNTNPNSDLTGWIKLGSWPTATSVTDVAQIANGSTVHFAVRALDQCNKGMFSNIVTFSN